MSSGPVTGVERSISVFYMLHWLWLAESNPASTHVEQQLWWSVSQWERHQTIHVLENPKSDRRNMRRELKFEKLKKHFFCLFFFYTSHKNNWWYQKHIAQMHSCYCAIPNAAVTLILSYLISQLVNWAVCDFAWHLP